MTDTNTGRRRVLKKIGTASAFGASALATAGTAAGSPGRSGRGNRGKAHLPVDVNFNPNDEEQVVTFLRELGQIPEEETRVKIQERLNKPRAEAVTKVLKSIEFKLTKEPSAISTDESSDVSPAFYIPSWESSSEEFRMEAHHWSAGHRLWSWDYTVDWEHDGMELRNVDHRSRTQTHDFTWSHDGIVNQWIDEGDRYATLYRQHQFTYTGAGPIPSITHDPHIEVEVNGRGTARLIDSDNGV